MFRHTFWQAGHCPPVSNVFQSWPHVQVHRAEAEGSQEHEGQAIFMATRGGKGGTRARVHGFGLREDGGNTRARVGPGRAGPYFPRSRPSEALPRDR